MWSPAETVAHPGPARAAPSAPAARVGPGDPAGTALRGYAAEQARVFLAADARVADGGPDPSRQLRLAARRLRCMLRVFGTLIEPDWAGSLGAELRWIGGVLGGEWERRATARRDLADMWPEVSGKRWRRWLTQA
jgi:hypothetical protein